MKLFNFKCTKPKQPVHLITTEKLELIAYVATYKFLKQIEQQNIYTQFLIILN
jgi:hypothetical protein